jgi:hypothetical protein
LLVYYIVTKGGVARIKKKRIRVQVTCSQQNDGDSVRKIRRHKDLGTKIRIRKDLGGQNALSDGPAALHGTNALAVAGHFGARARIGS